MSHRANDKVNAGPLTGVSETALLTLYGRAYQASRPVPIIDDPMAIRLAESIDFDFEKFGRKGQEMALRSLAVDHVDPRIVQSRLRQESDALGMRQQALSELDYWPKIY